MGYAMFDRAPALFVRCVCGAGPLAFTKYYCHGLVYHRVANPGIGILESIFQLFSAKFIKLWVFFAALLGTCSYLVAENSPKF